MTKQKQLTVSERWELVAQILIDGKVSKKVQTELENILAPKSASSVNPPLMDGDTITHYWDRWFDQYVSVQESVLSNGKPKGYSKASLSKWNKIQATIKDLTMDLAYSGKTRDEVEVEMKLAQKMSNDKSSFNYEDDTQRFINKVKYEMAWNGETWDTNDLPDEKEEA